MMDPEHRIGPRDPFGMDDTEILTVCMSSLGRWAGCSVSDAAVMKKTHKKAIAMLVEPMLIFAPSWSASFVLRGLVANSCLCDRVSVDSDARRLNKTFRDARRPMIANPPPSSSSNE